MTTSRCSVANSSAPSASFGKTCIRPGSTSWHQRPRDSSTTARRPYLTSGSRRAAAFPSAARSPNYAVYVSNGPELIATVEDDEIELEGVEAEGFGKDSDGKKVFGGRLGIVPLHGFQSEDSPMAMPPKGGNPSLTEANIQKVVAYLKASFGTR